MTGDLINRLMIVTFNQPTSNLKIAQQNWHLQLGHPSNQNLKSLRLHPINKEQCDTCAKAKMTLQPFKGQFTDQYFLTIIDQFTSFKITHFLKNKSDSFTDFSIVKNLIETSQERKIKRIVSDRGGKFMNQRFKEFTEQTGIQNTFSSAYTPEHNVFSKRANRNILYKARFPAPKRIRVTGPRHPTLIYSDISEENILPYCRRLVSHFTHTNDPNSFNKAVRSSDSNFWIAAVQRELDAIKKLDVWDVIPIKEEHKLSETALVFKTKRGIDSNITEYKARLCAQDADYTKNYCSNWTAQLTQSLDILCRFKNLKFEQLDIKSRFLNAKIKEDMYLSISQGLENDKRQTCLKLKRAIYRLKQAPFAWYRQLKTSLKSKNFNTSNAYSCVFYKGGRDQIWLFSHVDDIGVFGDTLALFKQEIEKEFKTKILGAAALMFGIKQLPYPKPFMSTPS
ncbi:hypothetical protein O181_015462 [Austropuccinia psidii MF-1]|uniref:Integrase catalytic domain-containing protein n=1 Tax=Austropuccinia psidii MF-1 TaxID=1389203 RepID=A0A9Q3C268_9BASI|nr:hypothetical protein [Austropuccinia psidii MF-1]